MKTAAFEDIPIVDVHSLLGPDSVDVVAADRLQTICHQIGLFLVVGHGIDQDLTDSVFEMMERFFALPVEIKQLIDKASSPHFRGWEPVGSESTNDQIDVREQIDIWSEWEADHDQAAPTYHRLHGPNQWLPDEILSGHRELSLRWFRELEGLAKKLLTVLWAGLGLDQQSLRDFYGDRPMSLTKFIRYPPTPMGGAGVNPHRDTGFLTVLAPGTIPGLQVQNQEGVWIDVPVVPGALVVNLGEMLQAMTGNYLIATAHRVISPSERFSTGFFQGPSLDTPLAQLPIDQRFADIVKASPHHGSAGFMATPEEIAAGEAGMASNHRPDTYGQQLWNYLSRSYPKNMVAHHPKQPSRAGT